MSKWLAILNNIELREEKNLDEMLQESTMAKTADIGFVHPVNGSGILARENGILESFADYGLGFRVDPASKTFSIYASNIQLFCTSFKIHEGLSENLERIDEDYSEILDMIGGKIDEEI